MASGTTAKKGFLNAGVSNSFSAAGHIYIRGFHTGQTLLTKKFKQDDCISVILNFLSVSIGNRMMKFRGTPATALFGDYYFSRQLSLKVMRRSLK